MKNIHFAGRLFDPALTTPRISVSHRVLDVLLLLLFIAVVTITLTIAVVTVTSTTGGKQLNSGANLMLAPGQPGLEPALY